MNNLPKEETLGTIESIFNSKKIKYSSLKELLKPYISNYPQETNVNIFLDIQSLLKSFYNPQVLNIYNSLSSNESLIFISEIFNIVGHYRHFFASRYQMYTTFYLYNSFQKSSYHLKLNNDYRKDFYFKRIDDNQTFNILNSIIKTKFKMFQSMVKYVTNVFYIDTKDLEPSVFPYFFINNEEFRNNNTNYKDSKENINLIISNDKMQYQSLLNSSNNTILLELRSEKSRIIYNGNLIETLIKDSKSKSSIDVEFFNNSYLPILYSLSSNKDYNINGIKNMGIIRSIKFLEKNKDNIMLREIINPTENDFLFLNDFNEVDKNKFINNYKLINFNTIINKCNYEKNIITNNLLLNLIDYNGLMQVNDKVFKKFPINLDFLFEGE